MTNGCTVPVSEGQAQVSRPASHSHQDPGLFFFLHSDSARLEENGSLGLLSTTLPPKSSDRSDPSSSAQFPGLWAPSPLHLTGAFDLALGFGRKHKQGSSELALSGTHDAGHRHTVGLPREGEACRPHSALQPSPH